MKTNVHCIVNIDLIESLYKFLVKLKNLVELFSLSFFFFNMIF